MISLIGFSALCLSTLCSFFILVPKPIIKLNVKYFLIFLRSSTFLVCISFFSLMAAYITSDFSNFNVFQNQLAAKAFAQIGYRDSSHNRFR